MKNKIILIGLIMLTSVSKAQWVTKTVDNTNNYHST